MADFISWETEKAPEDNHNSINNNYSYYVPQTEEKYPLSKDEQIELNILADNFRQQDPLISYTIDDNIADDNIVGLPESMLLDIDDVDTPNEEEIKDDKDVITLTRISTIIHDQKITDINKYLLLQLYYDWKEEKSLRERLEKENDRLSESYINVSNILSKRYNDREKINKLKSLLSTL